MPDKPWLLNLKTGDKVIVKWGVGVPDVITTVTHDTPTQIRAHACKFRRRDGNEITQGSNGRWLVEYTPEAEAEIEAWKVQRAKTRTLENFFQTRAYRYLSATELEAMYAALPERFKPQD